MSSDISSDQSMSEPDQETSGGIEDERTFRERVAANPQPALLWLAGLVVLVAVEFGRFLSGFLMFWGAGTFLFHGLASIPAWFGNNFASVLGSAGGAVVQDLVSLALLFVLAVAVRGLLPFRPDVVFGLDLRRSKRIRFERFFVTGVLAVVAALLAFTPLGAFIRGELAFYGGILESLAETQTLLNPETISNQGHQLADGSYEGTFLGLSPRAAWGLRFALVWVYVGIFVAWLWRGYNVFRTNYRKADWTPRDDTLRRLRHHNWGLFGLFVVIGFIALGAFAPAISPYPIHDNIYQPYQPEAQFEYFDEESGEVLTTTHGEANLASRSQGAGSNNVGINEYDDFGRYAPLGTTHQGGDMLTNIAYGARTSLVLGLVAVTLAALIAVTMSLASAYYKGLVDILVVVTSDTIISFPILVLVLMLTVVFQQANHWIAQPMDGGLLLALIFAFAYWPGMWRAIRGPSLQVSEEEWVDAAKSYGQTPLKIMRKHMAPYVFGYLIIYASLLLGGMIIVVAALSFLGFGITEPTPEWGRLINSGRPYIATKSWHISTVSGLMIALVVTGFNALGDGLRDAIDPQADANAKGGAGGGA